MYRHYFFVDLAENAKKKAADKANETTTLDPKRCESCYGAENSKIT